MNKTLKKRRSNRKTKKRGGVKGLGIKRGLLNSIGIQTKGQIAEARAAKKAAEAAEAAENIRVMMEEASKRPGRERDRLAARSSSRSSSRSRSRAPEQKGSREKEAEQQTRPRSRSIHAGPLGTTKEKEERHERAAAAAIEARAEANRLRYCIENPSKCGPKYTGGRL